MSTINLPLDIHDPYRNCEHSCTHDLGKGALVGKELLRMDGPYPNDPPRAVATWIQEAVRQLNRGTERQVEE